MKEFIVYLLKSGLWLTAFFAIYRLFLRKETFFRFNRFFLLSGLIFSVILPAYQVRYPVNIVLPVNNITVSTAISVPEPPSFDWLNILYIAYFVGVCLLFLVSLTGIKKLRALITTHPIVGGRKYKIVDSPVFNTPFSAFNYIFMNFSRTTEDEKKLILDHEQSHIEQYHWVDLVLVKIICMVQWYNPIIWRYAHSIVQNHEYLADEAVLQKGNSPSTYQSVLLNYSLSATTYPFTNSFAYSTNNLKRFNMMKTQISNPVRKWAVLLILPMAGLIFWAFAEPEYIIQNQDQSKAVVKDVQSADASSSKSDVVVAGYKRTNKEQNIDNNRSADSVVVVIGGKMTDEQIEKNRFGDVKAILNSPQSQHDSVRVIGHGEMDDLNLNRLNVATGTEPLLIVDGERVPYTVLDALNPEKIESISVLKDNYATNTYGDKGKNGVIIVRTKGQETKFNSDKGVQLRIRKSGDTPLYIVDGVKVFSIDNIKPDNIENVSVLKDKLAVETYGEAAKNGVVIITTKKEIKK